MARGLRQYGAALLLFHLLAACTPAAEEQVANRAESKVAAPAVSASPAAGARKLVVAFGDSLYAGYRLGPTEGLAPALQRDLAERGVAAEVFNAGVSGDTSAAGRQRLGFVLDGLKRKPDLVLVGLGANDMLRGLSPAATRANLAAILTELKQREIPAMLTGMLAAPNMGPEYAGAFNAIYPGLAKTFGVPLYPFLLDGVIEEYSRLLPDGIHPNPQGVEVMADRVGPIVAEALKD